MSNTNRITGMNGREDQFTLPDIFSSPSKSRASPSPMRKKKKIKKRKTRRYDGDDDYDDDVHVVVKPTSYESSSDSDGEEEDSKYYYDDVDTSRMISDRHKLIKNMKREWSNELERIHFNKEYYKMKTPHLIKYLKRMKLNQNFQENSNKLVDSTVEELFDILFQSFAQGSSDGNSNSNKQLLAGKKGRLFEVSEFGFLVKSKKNVMVKKFKGSFRQTLLKFHRNYNVFKKFERGNLRRRRRQKAKEMEMEEKRGRFRSVAPNALQRKSAREFCEEEMNFVQLFYQIKSDLAKEREIVNVLQRRLESEILELRNKDFEIFCIREQLKKRDHFIDRLKKKCYKELMKMKSHFSRNQYEENEKMKKRMNAYRELLKNPLPYTIMKTGELDLSDYKSDSKTRNKKKKKKSSRKENSVEAMMKVVEDKNKQSSASKRTKGSSTLEYLKKKLKEEEEKERKKELKKKEEEEEGEETDFFKSSDSEDEDEDHSDETESEKKERINRAFAPIHFFQPLSIFSWGISVKLEVSKMLEKQKTSYELLIHQLKKSYLQKERKEFQKYLDIVNRLNEILIASSGATSSSGNRVTSSRSSNNNSSSQLGSSFDSSKHITDQFQEQSNIIANLKHQNMELQNEMNRMREKEFQTAKETIHNMIQAEKLKKKNEFLTSQLRKKMIHIQELCDRLEEFKLITRNEYDHYMTHDAFGDSTFEQSNLDQSRNVNFLISKKKALQRVEEENKKFLRLLDRVQEIKQLEIDCARHNSLSEENMKKVDRKWDFIRKTLYNYVLAI